jgi:hypothetical protein
MPASPAGSTPKPTCRFNPLARNRNQMVGLTHRHKNQTEEPLTPDFNNQNQLLNIFKP